MVRCCNITVQQTPWRTSTPSSKTVFISNRKYVSDLWLRTSRPHKYDIKHWHPRVTYIVRKFPWFLWGFTENNLRYDVYANPYLPCLWSNTEACDNIKHLRTRDMGNTAVHCRQRNTRFVIGCLTCSTASLARTILVQSL